MSRELFKNRLIKVGCLIFLLLLLIFPSASLNGAKAGLILWWDTLLPTLLPFMIVSSFILRLRLTHVISRFLYPVLRHLLPVSKEGCYPVFIGFLAGMPIGAKLTADLRQERLISHKEAQMLCAIANNASPMFIIGYIAGHSLNMPRLAIFLIIILYTSSLLSGRIAHFIFSVKSPKTVHTSAIEGTVRKTSIFSFELLDDAILSSFEVVTKVGGYVILFSVLSSLLCLIPMPFSYTTAILTAILEITTGIKNISETGLPETIKIVLITTITAFGGLSGFAQTKSVLGSSGLSGKYYFITKLLSACIACILTLLLVNIL